MSDTLSPEGIAAIVAELRHNDECGPGPVSDAEYRADAGVIYRALLSSVPMVPREEHQRAIELVWATKDRASQAASVAKELAAERDAARAEADRLREALTKIAAPTLSDPIHAEYHSVKRLVDIARAALAGGDEE